MGDCTSGSAATSSTRKPGATWNALIASAGDLGAMRVATGSTFGGSANPTGRIAKRATGTRSSGERRMEAGYPEGRGGDYRGGDGGYAESKRGGARRAKRRRRRAGPP